MAGRPLTRKRKAEAAKAAANGTAKPLTEKEQMLAKQSKKSKVDYSDPRLWNEDGTRKRCTALRSFDGQPCRYVALYNGKCKYHGGAATGPHNPAKGKDNPNYRHGLYSKHMTDDDYAVYTTAEVGTVDNELRLCRVRLNKALEQQHVIEEDPLSEKNEAGMEIKELREENGMGAKGPIDVRTKVVARRDYQALIDSILARIGKLEKLRAELLLAGESETEKQNTIDGLDIVEYKDEE